jgi:hypothetical protein
LRSRNRGNSRFRRAGLRQVTTGGEHTARG